jgi:hypothetical protein
LTWIKPVVSFPAEPQSGEGKEIYPRRVCGAKTILSARRRA